MELGLLKQRGEMVIVEVVLNLIATTSLCPDQASLLEKWKLMGDCRLAYSGDEGQISDAEWFGQKCIEQLGSRLVAKRPKRADD